MRRSHTLLAAALLATAGLVATGTAAAAPEPAPPDSSRRAVELVRLGTHATGLFDAAAAEISAYDPRTKRLFVVNAESGAIDVLDVADPARPTRLFTLATHGLRAADGSTVPAGAAVNSVDVHDGVLAVAVESDPKTDRGWALFFDTGEQAPYRSGVRVGSQPDMITFAPDGRTALTADESEPADDFSADPEGSVSVIDVSRGIRSLRQEAVRTAGFRAFDEGTPLPAGVRVYGPDVPVPSGQPAAGRVARNLEPEYITIDRHSRTAYVTLQEANTVATLDLRSARVTEVWSMPLKDWSTGEGFDASDRDGGINIRPWPVTGLAMPDTIASYTSRGQTLLVTANEGDAREWGDYAEPARVDSAAYGLCADVFPDAATLKQPSNLGRLNVSTGSGLRADGSCYERIDTFGARSFSILTTDGSLVFDSGSLFEQKIAELITAGELPAIAFNANNTENPAADTRSDDKGVEPEGIALGEIRGRTYAFVGFERIGGVMVFDITDPRAVTYVDYVNDRNWDAVYDGEAVPDQGDLGAEGVRFIPGPRPMIAVANEVSGSTTLYAVEPARR
jgi:DNA-binding beta-propeller fold protein YncE